MAASGDYGGYAGLAVYGHPEPLPGNGPVWSSHDNEDIKMGATRSWSLPRERLDQGALRLQLTPIDQVDCDADNGWVRVPTPDCEEG